MTDIIFYELQQLVPEIPCIIVCIGCIAAAIIFWQRAPSASLYVVLGCALTLVIVFAFPLIWFYVRSLGIGMNPIVRGVFSFGISLAGAIKIVLLVIAAYIGRRQS
jgi:hypothetical protein